MPLTKVQAGMMGSGTVLQVVSSLNQAGLTSTSTTYVDIANATVTITPTSATNKILVLATGNAGYGLVSGVNVLATLQLLRGSTSLQELQTQVASVSGGLQQISPFAFSYHDSPNTVSATTYKLQQKISTASSSLFTTGFWVIAMEIAG